MNHLMGGGAQVEFADSTDAEVRFSGHEWVLWVGKAWGRAT